MTAINITLTVDELPATSHVRWVAGQDVDLTLTVTNTDLSVFDLTGCTAVVELEDPDDHTNRVAFTVTTSIPAGTIRAQLTASQTAALVLGRWLWRITLTGDVNRELVRGVAINQGRWG